MHERLAPNARARRRTQRGGVMLLWAFAVNAIFLVFVAGYVPFLQNVVRVPWFSYDRDQALGVAEAAMEWALADIATTIPSSPSSGWVAATTCDALDGKADTKAFGLAISSCYEHTAPRPLTAGDGSAAVLGTYKAWIVNYGAAYSRILARGYIETLANPRATRMVSVDLARPGMFDHGVYADANLVSWGQNEIDSYDSSLGAYNATTNKTQDGDIGTNGNDTDPADDIRITHQDTKLEGDIWKTPGDTVYVNPLATFTGSVQTRTDVLLPHVIVPNALDTLPITAGNESGWSGFFEFDSAGHFKCSNTTCVCDKPVHVRSLMVDGTARMQIGPDCQLLVDKQGTTSPYGGLLIDINGNGRIVKMASGMTNQIFIRDGGFDFDGEGVTWDAAIPDVDRLPEQYQIYATCSVPPCNNSTGSAVAQSEPFYGLAYVEGGDLAIRRGSVNGWAFTATYFGAFVSGRRVELLGIQGDQYLADGVTPGQDGVDEVYPMILHYDKSLADLMIDGTGRRGYKYVVRPGSWRIY